MLVKHNIYFKLLLFNQIVVIATSDDWLQSLLQSVSCKTVVVITTEDTDVKVIPLIFINLKTIPPLL